MKDFSFLESSHHGLSDHDIAALIDPFLEPPDITIEQIKSLPTETVYATRITARFPYEIQKALYEEREIRFIQDHGRLPNLSV